MRWLERLGFLVSGGGISAAILLALGKIELAGDFAANVAGATIGGMISIGLAIRMFAHERRVAKRDAAALAASRREQAIREALRYVRAIRERVIGATAITINNCDRIITSLKEASAPARRALDDINLTDFPLRLAMADTARIGHQTAESLGKQVQT
jgi:cytochrome P450